MVKATFNITIEDSSPLIRYSAVDETGPSWKTYYEGSGYVNTSGEIGSGTSYHVALEDLKFEFDFAGTGINIMGRANCPYNISIDHTSFTRPPHSDLLAHAAHLTGDNHTVLLHAYAADPQFFMFEKAIVTVDLTPGSGEEGVNHAIINSTSSIVNFSPADAWSTQTDADVPSPFWLTTTANATAFLSFTGRAVAVYSHVDPSQRDYAVSLDGREQVFQTRSISKVNETLRFYAIGLDPETSHSLSLTNLPGGSLSVHRIEIWGGDSQLSPTTPSTPSDNAVKEPSSPPLAAILGPVLGFLFAVILVAAFFWYKARRRPGHRRASLGWMVRRRLKVGSAAPAPEESELGHIRKANEFKRDSLDSPGQATPITVDSLTSQT